MRKLVNTDGYYKIGDEIMLHNFDVTLKLCKITKGYRKGTNIANYAYYAILIDSGSTNYMRGVEYCLTIGGFYKKG